MSKTDRRRSSSHPRSSARTASSPVPSKVSYPPSAYPTLYAPSLSRASGQHHVPYPPFPPMQDPQTQYNLAHAVNYLSYILHHNLAPPNPHTYSHPPTFWPQTPQRRSRGRTRHPSSSPSRSSPRESSSAYAVPSYDHPSPSDLDYSIATSPPVSSSPLPSSPTWPVHHHEAANGQARSKSRGRKVSFKFDSEDEQNSRRRDNRAGRSRNEKNVPAPQPSQRPPVHSPDVLHRRVVEQCSDRESDVRQPRGERGRTPGPSLRHSRSYSAKR